MRRDSACACAWWCVRERERPPRDLHVSACTAVLQPVRRDYPAPGHRTPLPSPPRHLQNMDGPLSNDAFNDGDSAAASRHPHTGSTC